MPTLMPQWIEEQERAERKATRLRNYLIRVHATSLARKLTRTMRVENGNIVCDEIKNDTTSGTE